MTVQTIRIDIFSDIACPWCYLGQKRLHLALESLEGVVEGEIHWKPFQLDPDTPREGYDAEEHLAAKLGGREAVVRSHGMLTDLGKKIGLPFDFDRRKRLYNTFDAHRLIHWAGEKGRMAQDMLVQSLFQANFVEGLDISEPGRLAKLAGKIGFDENDIFGRLKSDRDKDLVTSAIDAARRMGISGVPCFIFEKQYAVTGAQETDVFIGALQELVQMKSQAATPA